MNTLMVLPIVLPLLSALASTLFPQRSSQVALMTALLLFCGSLALLTGVAQQGSEVHAVGGWPAGLGISLYVDALAALFLVLTSTVGGAATLYATGYFTAIEQQRFWPLWWMMITAINALLLSADLFNLYVTLELLGLSAVALTTLGGQREALQAALRYLLLGLIGSLLFLAGVVLIYASYGTLDLAALGPAIAERTAAQHPATLAALLLMSSGLMIKCALFPLHIWLPPAHASAPAPVSAALSALVVKVAFYLLMRLWLELFTPVLTPLLANLVGALGALAVIWGSWQALIARRLKLLAAYSTVAQMGYLFLFVPLLATLVGDAYTAAYGALVVFALSHGLAKSALFMSAGIIKHHGGHDEIARLGGTAQRLPITTFALALAGVALVGLPPSGAFLGKWQLMSSSLLAGQWWWLVVTGIGSLLAAGYLFRTLGHAFGPAEGAAKRVQYGREEYPVLLLALGATLGLGLGSTSIWELLAADNLAGGVP